MNKNLPAIILAGGMGTRIREESEYRPKPMVEIGGKPIIWHIMKNLAAQGITEFIICAGYKGDVIRDYFLNYYSRNTDFTVDLGSNSLVMEDHVHNENWRVTIAETGLTTATGGRVHKVRKYLKGRRFLCTYGDGLADIDLDLLISHHEKAAKNATVTAVQPLNRFGALEMDEDFLVTAFKEKQSTSDWVNGGFFIFEDKIFDYLDESSTLEKEPLEKLARDGQLSAYKHTGFWQPMDTYRESLMLNQMWESNNAPWKKWQ
jgi:glucose-1-phosphate cytidylyltransferase